MNIETTKHKELVNQYAELALANLRSETGGKEATTEMLRLQSQLQMSHEQIMKEHSVSSLAKI